MKVLFAIGDAVTSENIVKQYHTLYGEKIEYKNVFYFKALLEEVKKDKTYDRIVIAEQLEPPQRNVVDTIDQMLFNNIDSITDEIEDSTIIFICSDGRTKNDSLIGRLFNIGIYNLLMGDERDIVPLCKLIKDPRNKKEAKEYLKSNPAVGDAVLTKDGEQVDEIELLNISKYFNNLKTREEYLEKFAIVEEQYNEKQLQIIVTALFQNLKRGKEIYETLRTDSRYSKYCIIGNYENDPIKLNKSQPSAIGGILGFLAGKKNKNKNIDTSAVVEHGESAEQLADKASEEARLMMERSEQEAKAQAEALKRESEERRKAERELKAQQEAQLKSQQEAQLKAQQEAQLKAQQEAQLKAQQEAQLKAQQEAQLRAQQEAQLKAQQEAQLKAQQEAQLKAQQEAQLKAQQEAQLKAQQEAQLKAQQEAQLKAQQEALLRAQQEAQLKAQQEAQLKAQQEAQLKAQQEAQLKAQQEAQLKAQQEAQLKAQQEAQLKAQQEAQLKAQQEAQLKAQQEKLEAEREQLRLRQEELKKEQESQNFGGANIYGTPNNYNNANEQINSIPQIVVPADYKKVVAFVGTNKVGTSFIINTVATLMAMKGVKTSILDMTQNRGMYWFYNETMYKKEDVVATCMSSLSNGIATPVQVGKYKNLSLYTTIPGGREDNRKSYNHRNVIETAKRNCNLLIIDCDFTTPYEYLDLANEVYIVQDLDLIKVKETKEFFRDLKTRRMDWSKLRVVMNNMVKCKVTSKKIIKNALTYYSDPSMTFTEEFDEIKKYIEIPLNVQNYVNYIEGMQNGKVNYENFTQEFKMAIEQLSIMVYGMTNSKKKGFFN